MVLLLRLVFLLCFQKLLFPSTSASSSMQPPANFPTSHMTERSADTCHKRGKVLVLDVDGTLYATTGRDDDVELQIRNNGYRYFKENLAVSSDECDKLYEKHGSMLAGVAKDRMSDYFNQVYNGISYSNLRRYSSVASFGTLTGYNDVELVNHRAALNSLIALAHGGIPIVIASNSPSSHVFRVLDKLGEYT